MNNWLFLVLFATLLLGWYAIDRRVMKRIEADLEKLYQQMRTQAQIEDLRTYLQEGCPLGASERGFLEWVRRRERDLGE
jgi:hypothetical protein